jgi:hypothetical protein
MEYSVSLFYHIITCTGYYHFLKILLIYQHVRSKKLHIFDFHGGVNVEGTDRKEWYASRKDFQAQSQAQALPTCCSGGPGKSAPRLNWGVLLPPAPEPCGSRPERDPSNCSFPGLGSQICRRMEMLRGQNPVTCPLLGYYEASSSWPWSQLPASFPGSFASSSSSTD